VTETARESLSEYAHRDAEQFVRRHTPAARTAVSLQARATEGRRYGAVTGTVEPFGTSVHFRGPR